MANCKRCQHPDYSHNSMTGICGASVTKLVHDWQAHEEGDLRWHSCDYEVEGECLCVMPGFENTSPNASSSPTLDPFIKKNKKR